MKKREKKIKVAKEPKDKFSLRMKRFYFGVIKEFRRVTWGNRNEVLKNFVIIISILFFLAVIFLGVDWCIVKLIAL